MSASVCTRFAHGQNDIAAARAHNELPDNERQLRREDDKRREEIRGMQV